MAGTAASLDVADRGQVERARRRVTLRRRQGRVGLYVAAIIAALLAAAAFIWGAITMFKQNADLYNAGNNPFWFSRPPIWAHVTYLLTRRSS